MLRPPQQTRAHVTLDRLLAVTEELLRTHTFAEVSLASIAQAAGVSTGAIFARFSGKDALLLALDESLASVIAAEADEVFDPAAWAAAPLESSLERMFRATIGIYRRYAGVIRAVHERRNYPPLRERLNAANRERIRRARQCVGAATRSLGISVSGTAIDLALLMCVSVIRETIVFGDFWPERLATTDRALARALAQAFTAQISAASRPTRSARRPPRRARVTA